MKKVEEKGLIDRMAEPTPDKSKKIGKVATIVACVAGAILTFGGITAPLGVAIVAGVGLVSGTVATYHGQQVDPNGGEVNFVAKLFKSLRKK